MIEIAYRCDKCDFPFSAEELKLLTNKVLTRGSRGYNTFWIHNNCGGHVWPVLPVRGSIT